MERIVEHSRLGRITLCRKLGNRRITLSVKRNGELRLSYPYGVSSARALEFAESRADWIEQTQKRQRARNKAVEYCEGMHTRTHTLHLRPSTAKRITIRITPTEAIVSYPSNTDSERVSQAARKAYTEALRAEAAEYLPGRLHVLSERHGLKYGAVRIKAVHSKWGSCTSRGDINLSLYLMTLPDALIDFVLLHELCHTVHHDHSKNFHALLDRLCGGAEKQLSSELRTHHPPQ